MGEFYRRYRGEATATGVVTLYPYPNYDMDHPGFSEWIGTKGVKRIALQVEGSDGSVELQGNNGVAATAGDWQTLEELTADGRIIVLDDPVDAVRVNVTAIASGTTVVWLTLGD